MYLSARPLLVRPDIVMGSKGSSVPEMVIPRGPPYRFSSTVYMMLPDVSCSSDTHKHTYMHKQSHTETHTHINLVFQV